MPHPFKGYSVAGTYAEQWRAEYFASKMRKKGFKTKVHKGTKGEAWGKKKIAYRVLIKD